MATKDSSILAPCRSQSSAIRSGVTVIEVLFAMFVVLFGLVALAGLLPLAGRQAGDSYAMTQGGAAMENAAAEFLSSEKFRPTAQRPWWFVNDSPTTPSGTIYTFSPPASNPPYGKADSMQDIIRYNQERRFQEGTAGAMPPPATAQIQVETARRDGLAIGFCIDPLFCADQFFERGRYGATWGSYYPNFHYRGPANNQAAFRRSRMPFFDERTALGATSFAQNTTANNYEFPKLMRVSFATGTNSGAIPPLNTVPLNIQTAAAERFVSSGSDCLQADATDDKTFGALRSFFGSGGFPIQSTTSSRISWLATLTPSEQTDPGFVPNFYNLSFVVFNNRDRNFDAAPLAVTGSEKFPEGEKMCFATSSSSMTPNITQCGQLPFSQQGGAMELQLWSDINTDTSVRVGDWVMLSRRIAEGNHFSGPPGGPFAPSDRSLYKVTHRHRWYRVIGIDQLETWPRVIRVSGEPWDYPEISTAALAGNSSAPVVSNDNMSVVTDLNFVATTATIFRNVVVVYRKVVSVE